MLVCIQNSSIHVRYVRHERFGQSMSGRLEIVAFEDLEEEDGFPKKVLLQFVAEKVCREEVVAEISLWAKGQREKELEDKHLWQEVLEDLGFPLRF